MKRFYFLDLVFIGKTGLSSQKKLTSYFFFQIFKGVYMKDLMPYLRIINFILYSPIFKRGQRVKFCGLYWAK